MKARQAYEGEAEKVEGPLHALQSIALFLLSIKAWGLQRGVSLVGAATPKEELLSGIINYRCINCTVARQCMQTRTK